MPLINLEYRWFISYLQRRIGSGHKNGSRCRIGPGRMKSSVQEEPEPEDK